MVAMVAVLGLGDAQPAMPSPDVPRQEKPLPKAPQVSVSVYGSASFQDGFSVGSHAHTPSSGSAGLVLAGGTASLVLHDRKEPEFNDRTRWGFYSASGQLRSHRRGNSGGIILDAQTTKILRDLNVERTVKSSALVLPGSGNTKPDGKGETVLIGQEKSKNLRFGYDTGYSWIQSGSSSLALNPLGKNPVCVGTTTPKKKFTVGGGHLRVTKKLYLGEEYKAFVSDSKLQFEHGSGWMGDDDAMSTVEDVPVFTKGGGFFSGNVGIGTKPKFPTMRLQVHGGPVLVTDRADRGLAITQTKAGALMRAWNLDTKKHEALLIEGSPLLIQPDDGVALFGTTVAEKGMKLHIHGNLYVHGHMYAHENMHVRDHAVMEHLVMPSLSLKNKPQSPDGDTLVLGHTKMSYEGSSAEGPWEKTPPKKSLTQGVNLRLGYDKDYTWIQVHGKENGHHRPLALNPFGNTVSIGSTNPDKRARFYAKGNGYVLGTLYLKKSGQGKNEEAPQQAPAHATDYNSLEDEEAVEAMKQSRLRERKMERDEAESIEDFQDSTLAFLDVPEKLRGSSGRKEPSVHRLTEMFAGVLNKQELQLQKQGSVLQAQATKIQKLRAHLGV